MVELLFVGWCLSAIGLLILAYYDISHKTNVPATYPTVFLITGIVCDIFYWLWMGQLVSLLAASAVAAILFFTIQVLSDRGLMGDAEIEIIPAIWLFYPVMLNRLPYAVWAVILSALIGFAYGTLAWSLGRKKPTLRSLRKTTIPYIPFLFLIWVFLGFYSGII